MKYSLYENRLTTDVDNDFIARPVDFKINSREQLVKDITGPGSILKPTETNASIDAYWNNILNYIRRGEGYRDQYVTVKLEMGGVYITTNDRFDRDRHSLVVNLIPSSILTDASQEVKPEYVKAEPNVPVVDEVYDWMSDSTNTSLTPNGVLMIKGSALKIHEEPDEGVFFINQSNGAEVKADAPRDNEPQTLRLIVPALDPGEYRIEIRNTTRNGQTLRIGLFEPRLTVV